MRKVLFMAAVAAMTIATGANAQSFEWGAKAGVNFAWLTETEDLPGGGDVIAVGLRTGFHAGVFAEKVLDEFFGVQGELLYSQMGDELRYGDHDYKSKLDYLTLPVMAKVYPFNVSRGFSLDFGPQFGWMVSARNEDGDSIRDDLKDFDVSFVLGLSYKIARHYDVSARVNFGLTKPYDGETIDAKNRAISLGVGYRF